MYVLIYIYIHTYIRIYIQLRILTRQAHLCECMCRYVLFAYSSIYYIHTHHLLARNPHAPVQLHTH